MITISAVSLVAWIAGAFVIGMAYVRWKHGRHTPAEGPGTTHDHDETEQE